MEEGPLATLAQPGMYTSYSKHIMCLCASLVAATTPLQAGWASTDQTQAPEHARLLFCMSYSNWHLIMLPITPWEGAPSWPLRGFENAKGMLVDLDDDPTQPTQSGRNAHTQDNAGCLSWHLQPWWPIVLP